MNRPPIASDVQDADFAARVAVLIEQSSLTEEALAALERQQPLDRLDAVRQRSHGSGAVEVVDDWAVELGEAVDAAARGDRDALARVLHIVRPFVMRYCRARIGANDRGIVAIDDVAQEVCLAVMRALPRYRDQGRPFMAFVYGIAAHKVADAHRAAGRNRTDPVADVPEAVSVVAGPEQRVLEFEASREMGELLNAISARHREILVLRLVVGLSAEETAVAIGSTAGAVRVAQHRALQKLKAVHAQSDPRRRRSDPS
jgi:RNA polymerase sigma-70 factor (ECF subfamily)